MLELEFGAKKASGDLWITASSLDESLAAVSNSGYWYCTNRVWCITALYPSVLNLDWFPRTSIFGPSFREARREGFSIIRVCSHSVVSHF
jgi:hypothetical protein